MRAPVRAQRLGTHYFAKLCRADTCKAAATKIVDHKGIYECSSAFLHGPGEEVGYILQCHKFGLQLGRQLLRRRNDFVDFDRTSRLSFDGFL